MEDLNDITQAILDAAFNVHTELGPGLFESVYRKCLKKELVVKNHKVEEEATFPVSYLNFQIDTGFRIDLLVYDRVIVELKACERLNSRHKAQLLTYLKLTGLQVGLLINFNEQSLRDGIKRVVYNYQGPKPRNRKALQDR